MKTQNSVIKFLDEIVKRFSDNIAIIDGEDSYTFSDVYKISRAIGTWFLKQGISGENISVLLPKKASAILSFFGSLYAANTYVPLDYNDANERKLKIISKVSSPVVITFTLYVPSSLSNGLSVL